MKKNTIKIIMAALMILVFMGWGTPAFAGDAYLEGEHGIPNTWFLSGSDNGTINDAGVFTITEKGYCVLSDEGSKPENIDTYSEGERGIANHLVVSGAMTETGVERLKTPAKVELCLMKGLDKFLINDDYNYSLGEVGVIN